MSPDFFYITTFLPSNGGYIFKMNINNYHHYGLIISITSIHHEFTDNKDTFVLQRLFVLLSLSLVVAWALWAHARFTLPGCVVVPHALCGCHWQSHVYKVSGYTRAENSNLHWLAEVQRNTRLLIEFHTRPCSWIYIIYRQSNRDHVIMSHFTILMSTFSTFYHNLAHFTTFDHIWLPFTTLYHT